MNHEKDVFLPCVMAYFSCDKEMARTIIKSSEANGDFESLKKICSRNDIKNNHERGMKHG